jgi:hypothetical protein
MVVLKLYGHDNTRLNKNKKVTIRNGCVEENVIYECEIMLKFLTQTKSSETSWHNILIFLKTADPPINNARDSINCLVPLSLLCAFLHQARGCWEDN